MKFTGVMKYHWRRRWFLSAIFCACVLAITALVAVGMILMFREIGTTINAEGQLVEYVSYRNVAFFSDPGLLMDASAFSFLVFQFSLATLNRDRRFLVSLSVPRHQILLGTFLFLVTLSLALAVLGGLVFPVIARLVLMLVGFPIKGGWSAAAVLTGNNIRMWRDVLLAVCSMISTAGLFTFLGYVFLRWWKALLIIASALIVAVILLVAMVNWQSMIGTLVTRLLEWVQWFVNAWLPKILEFIQNPNPVRTALIQLCVGVGGTALSYPIMRGMKVS